MRPSRVRRGVRPARQRQEGVVLIIALIMLVVITIISVSTLRSTTTDERLASNARDRDKAFQAAEGIVRTCLARLNSEPPAEDIVYVTPAGVTDSDTTPQWERESNWADGAANSYAVEGSAEAMDLASDPRCMVERLGAASFRVTGRATGKSTDSVVMLQATMTSE